MASSFIGVCPERITLLFDCFAALGTLKGYGQTQLAAEMHIAPQIIRRRAADARHGRGGRGMPIDQVKQMCHIACREIPPLHKTLGEQHVIAWLIGLDKLTTFKTAVVPFMRRWMEETDPRAPKAESGSAGA